MRAHSSTLSLWLGNNRRTSCHPQRARYIPHDRHVVLYQMDIPFVHGAGKTGPFIARDAGLLACLLGYSGLHVSESRIILTISMVFLSLFLSLSLSLSLSVGYLRGFLRESTTWDHDDGYSSYLYDNKRNSFVNMNAAR